MNSLASEQPISVLFLCPHSAGKSLVAATYLQAEALRLGLNVGVQIAGTSPASELMPSVTEALTLQGFAPTWKPRLVTAADIDGSDVVINIGCEVADLPAVRAVIDWEVPLISVHLHESMVALHALVEDLARELCRAAEVP
jgi:protein-tyrosine-phosphatase